MTHALARLKERYGLDCDHTHLSDMARRIKAGKSILLAKEIRGLERHAVEVMGSSVVCLFAPERATVVTVLPRNAPLPRTQRPKKKPRRKKARRRHYI